MKFYCCSWLTSYCLSLLLSIFYQYGASKVVVILVGGSLLRKKNSFLNVVEYMQIHKSPYVIII